MNPAAVAKIASKALVRNAPSILSGFGIACFIGATISAAWITPKVVKRINAAKDERKKELELDDEEDEVEESSQSEQAAEDYIDGMTKKQVMAKYNMTRDEIIAAVRLYKQKQKKEKSRKTPGLLSRWEICKLALPMYLPAIFMSIFGIFKYDKISPSPLYISIDSKLDVSIRF